jgi:hypothetical protein
MAQNQPKNFRPKQKPLGLATVGAFESLTNALAVIFFNSSRAFKGITTT